MVLEVVVLVEVIVPLVMSPSTKCREDDGVLSKTVITVSSSPANEGALRGEELPSAEFERKLE